MYISKPVKKLLCLSVRGNVKMCNIIINTYCLLKMYQQLSNHYSLDILFGNFSVGNVAEGSVHTIRNRGKY